jgi:hypothetical protein
MSSGRYFAPDYVDYVPVFEFMLQLMWSTKVYQVIFNFWGKKWPTLTIKISNDDHLAKKSSAPILVLHFQRRAGHQQVKSLHRYIDSIHIPWELQQISGPNVYITHSKADLCTSPSIYSRHSALLLPDCMSESTQYLLSAYRMP